MKPPPPPPRERYPMCCTFHFGGGPSFRSCSEELPETRARRDREPWIDGRKR